MTLWAWERPEALGSLDPRGAGVAYLAQTITIRGAALRGRARLQPLRVPPGTLLLAVTRVEIDDAVAFAPDAGTIAAAAEALAATLRPGVRGIQVDFDARRSERAFYRSLLGEARRRMDATAALSMTALSSWAMGDGWIRHLPVDEVVPMCFEMGADAPLVRDLLGAGRAWPVAAARGAIGLALDEALPSPPPGTRRYVFSRGGWTAETIRLAMEAGRP